MSTGPYMRCLEGAALPAFAQHVAFAASPHVWVALVNLKPSLLSLEAICNKDKGVVVPIPTKPVLLIKIPVSLAPTNCVPQYPAAFILTTF